MFKQFGANYLKRFETLPLEKKEEMFNNILNTLYGGENELKVHLTALKEQSKSDEEISDILMKEINLDFYLRLSEIVQLGGIMDIIQLESKLHEHRNELFSLVTNPKGLERMFQIQKQLAEYQIKTLFNIDLEGKTREESKELLKVILYTTKENIAKEFGISKKTLIKWLKNSFGERFERPDRKIAMNEYKEIFEAFFLSDDEVLDLNNDLGKYIRRMNKGVNFNKSDIAFLCDSDVKTQKANLMKIALYSSANIFSYSVAKEFASRMGCELDF
ncbi:hypothetical protein [Flavobacterium ovatum]|uniref:hypothetical protein n=1 Tax=Flavobacterium ovatum TaxID=1928857 RepID=UPI00344E2F6B